MCFSLGDGTVHKIASYNRFNENFLYDAIVLSVADVLFSMMSGVIFFSSVGTVSGERIKWRNLLFLNFARFCDRYLDCENFLINFIIKYNIFQNL